ncbi:MAG: penicillin-binding transpeptidase domain-containing protein, partial [Ruthenibacterium sp.]
RTKLDITSFTSADRAAGPMVLGSSTYGVTPYELAGAYMMFGNGGTHTTLHSFTDVQTGTGRSVLQPEITTQQVIGSDTAYVMNRLLKGVMQGEGTGAGYSVQGDMESIGKTGTTSDNRDYWFVGLTPYYVTATWYGYDSGAALNTSMGTHAPTTAWRAVMQQTQRDMPEAQFPTDATVMMADYCTESGGLATAGCPRTRTGYYRAGTQPGTCILHAA